MRRCRRVSPSPPGALDRLAARAERAAQRSPQIRVSTPRGLAATRASARHLQPQPSHQLRELDELVLAELGEALGSQQLLRARERDLRLDDGHRTRRRLLLDDAAEDAVVDRDLLRTRDERQAPRPVQVAGGKRRSGAAELHDAARPDRKALVAQGSRKADQPHDRLSH